MSYILLVLLCLAVVYIRALRDKVKEKESCIQYYMKRDNEAMAALQEAQKEVVGSKVIEALCKLYHHGEE